MSSNSHKENLSVSNDSSSNNRSSSPHHGHSLSHSGHPPTSNSSNQSTGNGAASQTSGGAGGGTAARFRASVDATRSLVGGSMNSPGLGGMGSPGLGRGMRPSSEMLLGVGGGMGGVASPETEAIDKWFEDLQNYEATLEEMAAASLDQNFKEELSAIEQWFRVLSEAERTAALYSLLQSSTQVQIRFFITVLQQMARADPVTALLSPANPGQASMESQMEAKLASMGLKSPASPMLRQFARQSLGAGDSAGFLSPNTALHDNEAAHTLAQQRAKLKAQNHRISAPGQLHGTAGGSSSGVDGLKSPLWNQANSEQVAESAGGRSPSPGASASVRPKSTGSNISEGTGGGNNLSVYPRSPSGNFGDQLSPMVGGSWASMVNTPLVPMFNKAGDDEGGFSNLPASPNLETANKQLNNWSSSGNAPAGQGGIVLDDARKFRRHAKVGGSGSDGAGGIQGVLSGMYDPSGRRVSGGNNQQNHQNQINAHQQNLSNDRSVSPNPHSAGFLSSQAAAVAAQQNWRNQLLSSPNPSVAVSSPDQAAFNSMANNMAVLAGMHQQMQQQLQLQQSMMNMNALGAGMLGGLGGMGSMASPISPNLVSAGLGSAGLNPVNMMGLQQQQRSMLSPIGMNNMGMGMMGQQMGGIGQGLPSARRSPRQNERSPSGSGKTTNNAPGSGANPDEPVDDKLLNDIPAWLRSLRLHKYTPNFEGVHWKEMVKMDDAALDAKGVAALGARRKLLKVFQQVRVQKGMEEPGDAAGLAAGDDKSGAESASPSPEPGAVNA